MKNFLFQVIAAISFYSLSIGAHASGSLHADGAFFKDQAGRPVLLNGINLSGESKIPPFKPIQNLSQLQWIRDLGYNNIRLLFVWEAFEPVKGQYNYAYLQELTEVVREASRLGIYTLIDFHSDGFSRYTIKGCGSGAPLWTVPHPDTLHPGADFCQYWDIFTITGYLSPSSSFHGALDAFYSDTFGARTSYLALLHLVARHFKNFPMVIGYDVLNEPWGDEITQIGPLYEDAAKAIRTEDPRAILFLEPSAPCSEFGLRTKLKQPSFGNFAFAAHHYDPLAVITGIWFTRGFFLHRYLDKIQDTSRAWNAPLYLGEYGVSGSGAHGLTDLMRYYYHLYDHHFVSAAQWVFSPSFSAEKGDGWNHEDTSIVEVGGKLRKNFILRPHVLAVSGLPGKINTGLGDEAKDRGLEFEWDHDPKLGNTDFLIPPALRPDRAKVNYAAQNTDLLCKFQTSTSILSCHSPVPGKKKIAILEP